MSNLQKTIQSYNDNASDYASAVEKHATYKEQKTFVSLLKPKSKILDLGAGSGRDSAFFINNGFEVIAIDLSKGLIKECIKRHPEVDIRLMDMTKLNLDNKSFDAVWACASLLHLTDKQFEQAISEINRVIKPGGLLYVSIRSGNNKGYEISKSMENSERYYQYYSLGFIKGCFEKLDFEIIDIHLGDADYSNDKTWIKMFARKEQKVSEPTAHANSIA